MRTMEGGCHCGRVRFRAEVDLESGDEREGKSYVARFRLGEHVADPVEFDYRSIADHRGELSWCRDLAQRTRESVRDLGRSVARSS